MGVCDVSLLYPKTQRNSGEEGERGTAFRGFGHYCSCHPRNCRTFTQQLLNKQAALGRARPVPRSSGRARGSPCRPRRAAEAAGTRAATRPAREPCGTRCPARQRLRDRRAERGPAGSGGRAGEAPAPAPHRALRRGWGAEPGGGRDRPQPSPLPALARRARRGPGERLPHAAALGPAPAPPAAETAPKERERTCSSVPACLPAARTSSPAAHPPALRVLLPPVLGAGPLAPAGTFPRWLPSEGFSR